MKLYNSSTQQKEEFSPIFNEVGIYVCGVTPYDYCHIGHARVWITFDILIRYLHHIGYTTKYVSNITDIDDKILAKAEGKDYRLLTENYIQAMQGERKSLNVLKPDFEPRVTEYIGEIEEYNLALFKTGNAFIAEDSTLRLTSTGCALWKPQEHPAVGWESKFRHGRPGWHIECSTMSRKLLGETFDIHGGGIDLKFPHHENEIAQSVSLCGHNPANYWMHVGQVTIEGKKMSKSLGNAVYVHQVLEKYEPEVLRYYFLKSHYRKPLNFNWEALEQASRQWASLKKAEPPDEGCLSKFHSEMDNDLVTGNVLVDMAKQQKKGISIATQLKVLGLV